ncbi:hypothetical protein K431DRAFT_236819, partial [Polychaeton citri CBS 116435]
NMFVVVNIEGRFTFVLLGYEGSTNNGTVLRATIDKGFSVLARRYYLANSSYSKNNRLVLVLY